MVDQLLFTKEKKKAFKAAVEGTAQEVGKGEKEALEAEEQEEGEEKES